MDLLKTLLLYLSLTFAAGVQGADQPVVTPVPTATPVPVIIETVKPVPQGTDAVITAKPAVTPAGPTATAPAIPEITPNKKYKNLVYGDRGDDVKKLQKALVKLGYLESSDVDGAFGYKTRRAVMNFQFYNGLTQDGIAGKKTLTYLYEYKLAVYNPNKATASPAPTKAAPTPTPTATPVVTPAPVTPTPYVEVPESMQDAEGAEPFVSMAETEVVPEALIVLGSSGEYLTLLVKQDGVLVQVHPTVLKSGGKMYYPLTAIADGEGWSLRSAARGSMLAISADDYMLDIHCEDDVYVCLSDGEQVELAADDILYTRDEIYVSGAFFENVFHARVIWDADESTMILQIPNRADVPQA